MANDVPLALFGNLLVERRDGWLVMMSAGGQCGGKRQGREGFRVSRTHWAHTWGATLQTLHNTKNKQQANKHDPYLVRRRALGVVALVQAARDVEPPALWMRE